jgi:Leucine-rich repeat (LRR) protein
MELKSLQVIEVQDNNIKGTIPTTIGALTNLKILYLNNNNLEGTIPNEFFSLSGSLTAVNFGSNRLDGRLSKGWGMLKNLQVLQLYNNSFSGTLPDAVYGLHNLGEHSSSMKFSAFFMKRMFYIQPLFFFFLSSIISDYQL